MKAEISDGLAELFGAEVGNEHDEETGNSRNGLSSPGGVNPATLGSALDSLDQGLELIGYSEAEMDAIHEELTALIAVHGEDAEVGDFLGSD